MDKKKKKNYNISTTNTNINISTFSVLAGTQTVLEEELTTGTAWRSLAESLLVCWTDNSQHENVLTVNKGVNCKCVFVKTHHCTD